MKKLGKLFSALLISLPIFCSLANAASPCPFNADCRCSEGGADWQYNSVTCGPGVPDLPQFDAPEGSLSAYSVNILGDVSRIPANAFVAFKSIYMINLVQMGPVSETNWDDLAFANLDLQLRFSVSDLPDLLPIPEAVKALGRNGLRQLSITNSSVGPLDANTFSDFGQLAVIHIEDTPISNIDESAFAGLEENLYWLELRSAKLERFPREALRNLVNLEFSLELSDNGISEFHPDDFTPFIKLKGLTLSGNDLTAAVESGALNSLPETLKTLYLENGGLGSVPTEVIRSSLQLEFLLLSDNRIEALNQGDFPEGTEIGVLDLSGNPITTIQPETLEAIAGLRSIKAERCFITEVDFAMFEGLAKLSHIDLDSNPLLKSVKVTSPDKVPSTVVFIELSHTGIEYVDPNLDKVLDKPFVSMWFQHNTKLVCDESIHWMARRAFCSAGQNDPLLSIRNSECANLDGMDLEEYLKQAVPDPCQEKRLEQVEETTLEHFEEVVVQNVD